MHQRLLPSPLLNMETWQIELSCRKEPLTPTPLPARRERGFLLRGACVNDDPSPVRSSRVKRMTTKASELCAVGAELVSDGLMRERMVRLP